MNIHPDDPKWTAYVLGELGDAERAEVERELESSAEARELVDEIRMTAAGSVLVALPTILVFLLLQRHFIAGLTATETTAASTTRMSRRFTSRMLRRPV